MCGVKFIRPRNRWPVLAALLVFLVALAPLGWLSARMWQAAVRRDGERLNEFASAGWSQLARERLAHQRMMGAWVARLKAAPALDAAAWEGAFERGALGRFRAVGCAVWEGNERLRVRFCRGEGPDVGTDLATMPEVVAMLAQPPVQNATAPRIVLPGKGERVISLMSFQITDEPSRGIFVTRGVLFTLSLPEDFFLPERHNVQGVNPDGSYGAMRVEESFLPGVGEGHVIVQVVSDAERRRVRTAGGLTATRWLNGPLGELHLVYRPGPKFSTDSLASEARLAGGAGTLVALLLAALVWMQARQGSVLDDQVQKQTAKLLEANEELVRFKAIAETTSDFVGMCELDGTPLYVNQAGRALLGIAPEEPIHLFEFARIYPPETMALFQREGFAHAMEKGPWSSDLDLRHRDGHSVSVSFVGFVVKSPDGRPLHMGSMARDITKRRQLELQLREANAALTRFEAIVETTSDLVGLCELDGTPVYMNQAGRAFLGIEPHESLRNYPLDRIYPQDTLDLFAREGIPHAIAHGSWSAEVHMRHRDNSELPVSFVGFVIKSPEGRPLHLGFMSRDITMRRRLDQQLREALANERELVRLKSQFVNTVSHEFRTPLGVILSSADILTHYLDRLPTETRLEHLHDIHTSSRQMARMLDQVLDLGRIDAGKFASAPRPLDLTAFLQRIADESHSASGGAPIQLTLTGDLAGANGDEALLRHILLNLLSNARKYSPPDAPIEFTARREGDSAIFTVRDHGIGIPAGDLPHLFESFSRGGNVGDTPGTGLGLAIVKRCTDLQGGTIHIESEESHGALVTVSLPLFL